MNAPPGPSWCAVLMRCTAIAAAVATAIGCGASREPESENLKPITPEERILSIGKTWQESTRSERFVSEADVAFIRAEDRFRIHLTQRSRGCLVDIERDELIRTPQGREFHCQVRGAVQAIVSYSWRVEEARMDLRMPAVALRRTCTEPGFSLATKQFDDLNATYALRGDQLVAIAPATLRSSLIPSD